MTAWSAGSTFSTALQHGQVTSNAGASFAILPMIPHSIVLLQLDRKNVEDVQHLPAE